MDLVKSVYDDTHFEGLVYGRDMANTLTYCSATKLAYRRGSRTNAADEKDRLYYILIGQRERMGGIKKERLALTGQELQHGRRHGHGGRDVCELDDEGGQEFDHDVRHLHGAHGQSHHTLLSAAVNQAFLQTLNQLPLRQTHSGHLQQTSPRCALKTVM